MFPLNQTLKIGSIAKRWGFDGKLILKIAESVAYLDKLPESIFIEIQGRLVPFFILELNKQNKNSYIIELADTNDIVIDRLLQADVFILRNDLKTEHATEKIDETPIGYKVYDKSLGFIGILQRVWEREPQHLLVVVSDNKEILIPIDRQIVLKTNHKKQQILINAPEGLIDMYLNP